MHDTVSAVCLYRVWAFAGAPISTWPLRVDARRPSISTKKREEDAFAAVAKHVWSFCIHSCTVRLLGSAALPLAASVCASFRV